MKYLIGMAITLEEITNFLEVIIWPGTLLFIIILYKKHFVSAFNRLGSLKADATGISMEFTQKIEGVKEQAKALKSGIQFKGGDDIIPSGIQNSPFQQLLGLKVKLIKKVEELANSNDISIQNATIAQLLGSLEEKGVVDKKNTAFIMAVYDLMLSADQSITSQQYNDIDNLYLSIQV